MKGFFKKSGIYFDTEVKEGSNNAVTSDAVAKAIEEGGGGGGGSTDYADLTNKPKINNVELSGNKSLADLGVASETDLETLSDDVGDLSELTTTEKTSLVGAINEIAGGGGGGSSGGVKYQRFANKATTSSSSIGGVNYVSFQESNIKTWFDTTPTRINAIIAIKSSGTVVKVAIKNAAATFITEQANNAVTYEYVGVFYE